MYSQAFNHLFVTLFVAGMCIIGAIWGVWEIIDNFVLDNSVRTEVPLVPDIEIKILNGQADTTYIYHF